MGFQCFFSVFLVAKFRVLPHGPLQFDEYGIGFFSSGVRENDIPEVPNACLKTAVAWAPCSRPVTCQIRVSGAVHQDESIIDDLASRDGMRSTMCIRPALQTGQSGSLASPEVLGALLTTAAVD